jgi:hypothetical protein
MNVLVLSKVSVDVYKESSEEILGIFTDTCATLDLARQTGSKETLGEMESVRLERHSVMGTGLKQNEPEVIQVWGP